ncbi:MAG: hypothetical protein RBT25_03280 [Lentisphaeria bacterium]|nr:hypothetical protein [Lentisphaeria bacterium]
MCFNDDFNILWEPERCAFLRPDAKAQISMWYEGGKPVAVRNLVVSHQHTLDIKKGQLRSCTLPGEKISVVRAMEKSAEAIVAKKPLKGGRAKG